MKKSILALVIVISILMLFIWVWPSYTPRLSDDPEEFIAEAYYNCKEGKQIKAEFYKGPEDPMEPNGQPNPSGTVRLNLSDGRSLTLPQTISASGARYASSDESIIFWNKGDNAFIIENSIETYYDCTERIWNLGRKEEDEAVMKYILSRPELSWKTSENSMNLCVFENLYPEQELFPHYLWVRCGEFIWKDNGPKELSGVSLPVKIDYPNELSFYDQNKFTITIPRDGSLYEADIKEIFPIQIHDRLNFESGPLNEKINQKALQMQGSVDN